MGVSHQHLPCPRTATLCDRRENGLHLLLSLATFELALLTAGPPRPALVSFWWLVPQEDCCSGRVGGRPSPGWISPLRPPFSSWLLGGGGPGFLDPSVTHQVVTRPCVSGKSDGVRVSCPQKGAACCWCCRFTCGFCTDWDPDKRLGSRLVPSSSHCDGRGDRHPASSFASSRRCLQCRRC